MTLSPTAQCFYLAGSSAQYTAGFSQKLQLKLDYQGMVIKMHKFTSFSVSVMSSKHWQTTAILETGQNSGSDSSGSNSYFP